MRPSLSRMGAGVLGDPDDGAVAAIDLGLEAGHDIGLGQAAGEFMPPIGFDIELPLDVPDAADQLRRRVVAVDAGQGGIGREIAAVGRGLEDPLDAVLEDAAVAGFGFAEGGRGGLRAAISALMICRMRL